MKSFNISRLHSGIGIFRLSGIVYENNYVFFNNADFLSTDGWQEIDIKSEAGRRLLKELESDILTYVESN